MDEFSHLVDETFDLLSDDQFNADLVDPFLELPDEVPGILYHLQTNGSTFVVRIHPTDNLLQDYGQLKTNKKLQKTLKAFDKEELQEVQFFECDRVELASMIKSELGNKRFPVFEENVINISDPGYSWWLSLDEGEVKIYFKLSKTNDLHNLHKIGPIGDPKMAMKRFAILRNYFCAIFPLNHFSSAHGMLHMRTKEECAFFSQFQSLLLEGDAGFEFWDFLRGLEVQTQGTDSEGSVQKANYYLMQLGVMRKFWLEIQKQIKRQIPLQ